MILPETINGEVPIWVGPLVGDPDKWLDLVDPRYPDKVWRKTWAPFELPSGRKGHVDRTGKIKWTKEAS